MINIDYSFPQILYLLSALLEVTTEKPVPAKLARDGRIFQVPGGLDFHEAVLDRELGLRCLMREDAVEVVERRPKVQCNIR